MLPLPDAFKNRQHLKLSYSLEFEKVLCDIEEGWYENDEELFLMAHQATVLKLRDTLAPDARKQLDLLVKTLEEERRKASGVYSDSTRDHIDDLAATLC